MCEPQRKVFKQMKLQFYSAPTRCEEHEESSVSVNANAVPSEISTPTCSGSSASNYSSDSQYSASTSTDPSSTSAVAESLPNEQSTPHASPADFLSEVLLLEKPFQPPPDVIPPQLRVTNNKPKSLHFQQGWFERYKWLHYVPLLERVVCFTCAKAEALHLTELATKRETAFVSAGFSNWKKALIYFRQHELSQSHQFALSQMKRIAEAELPVAAQLSAQLQAEQLKAQSCLKIIFTTIVYLARQGLAFRGHRNDEGNFKHLLRLRAADNPDLQLWLERRNDMTSGSRQNEIVELFAHDIVRRIANEARTNGCFSIIVDGTQDVSGKEQESICIRYIDANLEPHEQFVGMYDPPETSGKAIATCVLDVLLRLQLPLAMLRGQTYDGAANMSGIYNGCQAIVRESQPLALFVHCGAHCVNLVAQKACSAVPVVRDAIGVIQELGAVFASSINCRTTFARIAADSNAAHACKIRPLCPTRWLVRVDAIQAAMDQYEQILDTLQELSASTSHVSVRAQGLYGQLQNTSLVLGLHIALIVLKPLELLNRKLQSRTESVAGMLECVQMVSNELDSLRSDDTFNEIMEKCSSAAVELGLKPMKLPRARKPPARHTGPAVAYAATTLVEYFKPQYFEIVDLVRSDLEARFSGSVGLQTFVKLENILLTGLIDKDLLVSYNELNMDDLEVQLAMFLRVNPVNKLSETVTVLRGMSADVRSVFAQVEKLVRIMLVCPCSSAEAERSFSSLRRLKTWLRSTMTQARLNSVAVCHSHQELLDAVDIVKVMREFVSFSDSRSVVFGRL